MSDTVEFIKAVAELLKPIWWPCTVFASIFMMRHELRSVIKRISKLRFGFKDASAELDLAPELIKAGEAIPLDEDKAQTLMLEARAEIKRKLLLVSR